MNNNAMNKILITLVIAVAASTTSLPSAALTLSFSPSSTDIFVGSPFSVGLISSDLNAPPAMGGFDLDVSFDAGLLNLISIAYGPALGNPNDALETLTITDTTVSGLANLFQVSFLADPALQALQSGSFTLATFEFSAITAGTGSLEIARALVSDTTGNLALPVDLSSARFTVNAIPNEPGKVPEPSTALLLGIGLLGWRRVMAYRRSRKGQSVGRHQSERFARNLAFTLAEKSSDASISPIGVLLQTCCSRLAGLLSPSTRSSASFTNSDLVTPRRRAS